MVQASPSLRSRSAPAVAAPPLSLAEIAAAVAAGLVPLPAESAGYLLLGLADQLARAPLPVDERAVLLSPEGNVSMLALTTTSRRANADEARIGADLRSLLGRLLAQAPGKAPALSAIALRSDRGSLSALIGELEAALIPVNRAAGRRALARLQREVERVRHRLPPLDDLPSPPAAEAARPAPHPAGATRSAAPAAPPTRPASAPPPPSSRARLVSRPAIPDAPARLAASPPAPDAVIPSLLPPHTALAVPSLLPPGAAPRACTPAPAAVAEATEVSAPVVAVDATELRAPLVEVVNDAHPPALPGPEAPADLERDEPAPAFELDSALAPRAHVLGLAPAPPGEPAIAAAEGQLAGVVVAAPPLAGAAAAEAPDAALDGVEEPSRPVSPVVPVELVAAVAAAAARPAARERALGPLRLGRGRPPVAAEDDGDIDDRRPLAELRDHYQPATVEQLLARFAPSDGLSERELSRQLKQAVGVELSALPPGVETLLPPSVVISEDHGPAPEVENAMRPLPTFEPRPPRRPRATLAILAALVLLGLAATVAVWARAPGFFLGH